MQIGIRQGVPARDQERASQIQSKHRILSFLSNPASPTSLAHVPVSPNLLAFQAFLIFGSIGKTIFTSCSLGKLFLFHS
jgi:hypothetical protein